VSSTLKNDGASADLSKIRAAYINFHKSVRIESSPTVLTRETQNLRMKRKAPMSMTTMLVRRLVTDLAAGTLATLRNAVTEVGSAGDTRSRSAAPLPMRILSFVIIGLISLLGAPSHAAEPAAATPAGSKSSAASCMDVTVNGYHTQAYDCLSRQMAPAPSADNNADPGQASGAIANRPSNQLGMFNEQTTSNRMGNTFGKSALPQRPASPSGAPPLMNGR
jgi:hypothetical protein